MNDDEKPPERRLPVPPSFAVARIDDGADDDERMARIVETALAAERLEGCTCDPGPEVRVATDLDVNSIRRVEVVHRENCAVFRRAMRQSN